MIDLTAYVLAHTPGMVLFCLASRYESNRYVKLRRIQGIVCPYDPEYLEDVRRRLLAHQGARVGLSGPSGHRDRLDAL